MKSHLDDVSQQAATAEAKKSATDKLRDQAKATLASADPIQAKLKFVDDVHAYARSWIALINTVADKSPKNSFIYTDLSVNGPTMTIKAYTPSVEEVGRYLQVMYNEPDFSTVVVDHVPGYPDNVRHLYYLNGRMVFADGASGSSNSSSASGPSGGGYPGGSSGSSSSGGSSGYPGGNSGGQSGGSSSSGPANFTPERLAANGPANIPDDVGPPPAELTGGAPSPSGQSGPGGSGSSGGGQSSGGYSPAFLAVAGKYISPFASPEVRDAILKQALRHVVTKTVPKGFDITVTATLKQPLTPPTLPGAAPAAGPNNRPGFGGSPGGSRPA